MQRISQSAALLLLLGSASCVEGNDPLDEPIPTGSDALRLVAIGSDGGGGAVIEFGIHDQVLGIDCASLVDAFGITRCLPSTYGSLGFFDASCTSVVGLVPVDGDKVPKYITTPVPGCGFDGRRIYRVGRELDRYPGYELVDGQCRPRGLALTAYTVQVHEVEGIEPTFFATLSERSESLNDRLSRSVVRAPDGTEFVTRIDDARYGQSCRLTKHEDRLVCGPTQYLNEVVVGDETCRRDSLGAIVTRSECRTPPALAWSYRSTSCFLEFSLVEVGEVVEAGTGVFLETQDGGCHRSSPFGPIAEAVRVHEVDPFETLATLPSIEVGDGRLVVVSAGPTPDSLPQHGHFHDRSLGIDCYALDLGDGHLCLPFGTQRSFEVFTDASCTSSAHVVHVFGATAPTVAIRRKDARTTLHEVGAVVDEAALYHDYGQGCEALLPGSCSTYRAIGAEIDASIYAPVRRGVIAEADRR